MKGGKEQGLRGFFGGRLDARLPRNQGTPLGSIGELANAQGGGKARPSAIRELANAQGGGKAPPSAIGELAVGAQGYRSETRALEEDESYVAAESLAGGYGTSERLMQVSTALSILVTLKEQLSPKPPAKPIVVDCAKLSENLLVCASQDNPNKEQKELYTDMKKMMAKHCL